MADVVQTSQACEDILEIGRYIAEQSESLETALRFLDRIKLKCELYATQPFMATSRPDLGDSVHVFSVGDYVVICQPIDGGIRVLRVLHGSRDIPLILAGRFKTR